MIGNDKSLDICGCHYKNRWFNAETTDVLWGDSQEAPCSSPNAQSSQIPLLIHHLDHLAAGGAQGQSFSVPQCHVLLALPGGS